jgi:hypothetical protein
MKRTNAIAKAPPRGSISARKLFSATIYADAAETRPVVELSA